jgi:hypothetical protein
VKYIAERFKKMTRLHPSFLRVLIKVGVAVALFCIAGYFLQGYQEGKWWTAGYVISLLIPISLAPISVWFMFVPSLIEFSDTEITIVTLLGRYTYQWSSLYCFGSGNNVYKIQFEGDRQPYQIFSGAYPKDEWAKLINLMESQYPERAKAWFSVGVRMTPKGKK